MSEMTDEQVFGKGGAPKEMTDEEVFGRSLQAPTAGEAIPEAFLNRVRAGQALARITSAAVKSGGEGYGTPTPTGLEDETLGHLIDAGIFHDPLKGKPSPIQFANETMLLPAAKLWDTITRGVNSGIHGAGGAMEQLVTEFGGSQGTANRAKNEVINAGNWAMIEGGMGRFSRPAATPEGVMDQTIGGLPRPEDFSNAAKVLDPTSKPAASNLRLVEAPEGGVYEPEQVKKNEKYFKAVDASGNTAAEMLVRFDGKTANIEDILAPGKPREEGRGAIGTADMRSLLRQFQETHPEIETITGKRVSGARMEGGYSLLDQPTQVEVNLRRMWSEDGIHPAEAVHDAQADAFLKNEIMSPREEVKLDPADAEVLTETGGKPGNLSAAITPPEQIPIDVQPASPPGRLAAAFKDAADTLMDMGRDAQMLTAPMARGTTDSMAMAKDFANSLRRSRWDWSRIDTDIAKKFTPEQRARMWSAADEESVSLQLKEPAHMREHQGLATLESAERAAVEELHTRAQNAWVRARDIGMVEGEGLPAYTPRMIVNAMGAGSKETALALDGIGRNLKTKTANMLKRKYLEAQETEAAAKAKYGDEAVLARDIRVLPLATSQLEDAIAGRTLINNIKKYGEQTGAETISEGAIPAGSDTKWFTLDHPAFRTWRPKLEQSKGAAPDAARAKVLENQISLAEGQAARFEATINDPIELKRQPKETLDHYREQARTLREGISKFKSELEGGKTQAVKDADGKTIFEQVPIYVHGDFEGPLRAVLNQQSGALYGGMMALKGKTMSLIMNSPMIHNAVEWGRALPAMPGKVATFKVYFEGNRAKNNVPLMHEAIDNGLVPIGHRFFNQDISGLMESPDLAPGRSWTAQIAGFVPGLFDPAAGAAVKTAIDKAGNFWHNTLLWDRVADLQMGLYTNFRADAIAKGIDPTTSSRMAAHFANRYAGALPKEAMSDAATKVSNMLMFSRSFTMGNLGVIKDMLTGLPKDVLAQIERDMGTVDPKAVGYAKSMARRKAMTVVAADMALLYVGNSLLQNAMNVMVNDSTLEKEFHGYATRFQQKMQAVKEHPLELIQPLRLLSDLSSTSENEPGKGERIHVGNAANGTAIYMRNPAGKIGEEFMGYMTGPLDMMRRKLGTIARPAWQIMNNDRGFGRKIYDPEADTPGKYLSNLGKIAAHIAGSQLPEGQIGAFSDLIKGEGDSKVNAMQAFGPFAGVTFAKGAPGGPAVGEMYANKSQFEFRVNQAMPDIRRQIQRGDIPGAQQRMTEIGMDPSYQRWVTKTTLNPATRIGPKAMRDFYRTATPEQRARFERAQQAAPAPAPPPVAPKDPRLIMNGPQGGMGIRG